MTVNKKKFPEDVYLSWSLDKDDEWVLKVVDKSDLVDLSHGTYVCKFTKDSIFSISKTVALKPELEDPL